jgi:hypothetical protein
VTQKPDSTKCPVCAEEFGTDPLLCCTGCETIHHRDCFEWNQQCAVYSCGGTLGRPLRQGTRDPTQVEIGLIEVTGRAPTPNVEKPPWRGTDEPVARRPRRQRFGQSVPLSFIAGVIFLGLIGAIGKKPRTPRYAGGNSKKAQVERYRKQPWLVQVDGAHPRSFLSVYRNYFNHEALQGWTPGDARRRYTAGCASSIMDCDREACAEQKGYLDYVPGMVSAARYYRRGTRWLRPSTRRSLYWYDRAALRDSPEVRDDIWEMASSPRLKEKDPLSTEVSTHVSQWPLEPRRWHDPADLEAQADGGNSWAAVCLGLRAEDAAEKAGQLPESLLPAVRWHARAAEGGSEVARARLHGIYLRGKKALSARSDLRDWARTMKGYRVARAAQDLKDL